MDYSCFFMIDLCKGLLGFVGAVCVVAGVVMTDGTYDNTGKTENPIGSLFFFGGWVLFALSIGLFNPSTYTFSFSLKNILGVFSSLLVIIAAARSQVVMYKQDKRGMKSYLLMFIGSWFLVAYAIALPVSGWMPDPLKLGIAVLGALGVIVGMIFQMVYRKRGFDYIETGKPSAGNVYSPGLPLFTGGWLLLAFANALV